MLSFSLVTATVALSALSVSARVVPRHHAIAARAVTVPSTYDQDYLEDYFTYHARYLALGCQYNHGNDFFEACCHPLLKNESLSSRESRCTPDATVLSSVSASLEGATSTTDAAASSTDVSVTSADAVSSTTDVTAASVTPAAPAPSSSVDETSTWSSSSTRSSSYSTDTWTSTSTPTTTSSASSSVQSGGFATFFYQNGVAGACGDVHSDYDYIVAMDSAIYSQDICGKSVTITNTANGKSVTATVADECPTCDNADSIDLSVGTFLAIGDLSTGVLDITWIWN